MLCDHLVIALVSVCVGTGVYVIVRSSRMAMVFSLCSTDKPDRLICWGIRLYGCLAIFGSLWFGPVIHWRLV
jgi:hypothetical protein